MTIKPLICVPHTRVSGGTRVLFQLAQGLTNAGIETKVGIKKITNKPFWLPWKWTFPMFEIEQLNKNTVPSGTTHIINFADNIIFGPPLDIPHILYFQGFGTQDYSKECINLMYPYSAVVATSRWLADLAIKFKHENIYIIPPGIDGEMFRPVKGLKSRTYPVVGCLYHESSAKNVSLFIASLNKLYVTKYPGIHALFLSTSTPNNQQLLSELVFSYSMAVNPPQQLLPAIYSSCDAWVSTSTNEGFGLPILEAMACGVPVATVRSFGLDEYLAHGKNCLVTHNTKESMVASISVLIDDGGTKEKIIKGGVDLASKFTWKKTVNAFIEVLKKTT